MEKNSLVYISIIWVLISYISAFIVVYRFGFETAGSETKDNKDIYKYVIFLGRLLKRPIPDPTLDTKFYTDIRKGISLFLIVGQTIVTIIIFLMITRG